MKIGLALGAGAARGWTHIGIISALQKMGLHIDVVAGTSIGAYVGATFASGNLDALREWSCSLTEWQVLSLMGVGLRRGGLASGQKVFDKLQTDFCAPTFEEMSKPFAAVATDLRSGREIVFRKGEVGDAIKASCAIPGLFSPVFHDDKWLIDGAVVNPVPVNLCRMLGADYVIAVNLCSDFRPQRAADELSKAVQESQESTDHFFAKSQNVIRQWLSQGETKNKKAETESENNESKVNKAKPATAPGIFSVITSALDILQARVTRSRLAGEPPDLLIEPHLDNVGLMEFHRAEELIQLGEATVNRLSEQIQFQLKLPKIELEEAPSE